MPTKRGNDMTIKEFNVISKYDNLALKGLIFIPEEEAKGIVQFVHGMCEHKKHYEDIMTFFTQNGYVTVIHDQRGHGESVRDKNDYGWFGDLEGKAIVEDAAQVTEYVRALYPKLSLTLFGHSMGSLVVRCYLRQYDHLIDKLVVCGSPFANPLAGPAVYLARLIGFFKGDHHRSKLLQSLTTGKAANEFEKKHGSWLTSDGKVVKGYLSDPMRMFNFTCNGYSNLLALSRDTYSKKGYGVKNPSLPIHFISGSADILLGNELKWFSAIELLREIGYDNVTGKLYEGMRHEIHNDLCKEEVYADVLQFLES